MTGSGRTQEDPLDPHSSIIAPAPAPVITTPVITTPAITTPAIIPSHAYPLSTPSIQVLYVLLVSHGITQMSFRILLNCTCSHLGFWMFVMYSTFQYILLEKNIILMVFLAVNETEVI